MSHDLGGLAEPFVPSQKAIFLSSMFSNILYGKGKKRNKQVMSVFSVLGI